MKRFYFILFTTIFSLWSFSQTSKTVENIVAGTLGNEFTASDYSSVTHLTISGNLNAYDFVFIRRFVILEHLNLLNVNIERHEGEVYHVANYYDYPANEFPHAGLRNSSVKSVVFPSSINSIGKEAFSNTKLEGNLAIPSGIKKIDAIAFSGCVNITSVSFPSDLETIGASAFSGCTNIANTLSFPSGLKTIDDGAFSFCTKLPGFGSFPASLTRLGSQAFRECRAMTGNVTLPSTLVSVGLYVFDFCNFTSATVELDTVPYGVFSSCANLSTVELINTEVIMDEAFDRCAKIVQINFPSTLKSIENSAFSNTNLTGNLVLPEGLQKIGSGAFYNLKLLTGVNIPASVTEISERAFMNCEGLVMPLNLPDQITKIGHQAFYGCKGLTRIKLPANNTLIEAGAFTNCTGAKSIIMPQQITAIDDYTFQGCSAVDSIYSYNTTPPVLGFEALKGISRAGCKIYVPDAAIDAYKAAPQWSEFGDGIVSDILPDTKAPELIFNYPGNKSGVSRTPSCILKFDEEVVLTDNFSLNIVSKSNQKVVYVFGTGNRVNTDSAMVYMEPIKNTLLDSNTTYEVRLAAGSVADKSGNLFPAINQSYEFTTGVGSPAMVLDFNSADYERESTENLGFVKSALYCMVDLNTGNQFFNHRFFSRDNFTEKGIGFSIHKYEDECLLETPVSYSPDAYVSLDNKSLVLNKANDYTIYPHSHTKALIDLRNFPAGYEISDVVTRISATSAEGVSNQLAVKAYFSGATEREFLLNGTGDAGYFDYESDTYGNKYYYRDIHFPVLAGETIDSLVILRNEFNLIKIMKTDIYYTITSKPVVNLGPDRNVCSFDDEYLDAGFFPDATYLWSTGDKTQKIKIGGTKDYWVDVKNMLGSSRDTVHITSYPRPLKAFNDSIIRKCSEEAVTLSALSNPTFTYLWNTGATTQSITVTAQGLYTCVVSNGVCSIIDSVGVVNTTRTLGFRYTPCCVAGYDDVQGELFKKNEYNRYELHDSKIMYGDMAYFNDMPDGEYIFKAHFLKYSNGTENPWLDTYHNGTTVWSAATPIAVDCGTDTLIEFSLASRPTGFEFNGTGSISGNISVRAASGAPGRMRAIRNAVACEARVMLYTNAGQLIATICPDNEGNYHFNNLPHGDYKLVVERTGYGFQDEVQVKLSSDQQSIVVNLVVDEESGIIIPNIVTGTEIQNFAADVQLNVYPNPASDVVTIHFKNAAAGSMKLQLTDLSGRLIFSRDMELYQGENSTQIVNKGWKGVYLLKLISESLTSTTVLIFE